MAETDYAALTRQIRRARGLTQEQLAQELGVSFSTVNCWENGRHRPIRALARQLLELGKASGVVSSDDVETSRSRSAS